MAAPQVNFDTSAAKHIAKVWRNSREKLKEYNSEKAVSEYELTQMEKDIHPGANPADIMKARLKTQKKLIENQGKLDTKRVETQDKLVADLEMAKEKNRQRLEDTRHKLEEKRIADRLKLETDMEIAKEKEKYEKDKAELDKEREKLIPKKEPKSQDKKAAALEEPTELIPEANPVVDFKNPDQTEKKLDLRYTGPQAIFAALGNIDLDEMEQRERDILRKGTKTKRPLAVDRLGFISGLRRNNMHPKDLMIEKVPVLPPAFRPYSLGDTIIPGDINLLYKDLIDVRGAYKKQFDLFGPGHSGDGRLALYDAVKASYGFGDPVNPKLREKSVSGTLQKLLGKSPKYSVVQSKLLAKPQDSVGRSTIIPDPDLTIDEVGIPESMAWAMFQPYTVRELVMAGYKPAEAIRAVKDKDSKAMDAMLKVMKERPIIYSRAPAWHKFNTLAAYAKIRGDNAIAINPMVSTGMNADYDGDSMNVHVISTREAVEEAKEKLMGSKQLLKIRNPEEAMPVPKHEHVLGLYAAKRKPSGKIYDFPDRASAIKAIKSKQVRANDMINILNEN